MDALIQSLVQSNFAPDRIVPQASMTQYTTLRIGGPADVLVNVVSADEIESRSTPRKTRARR